LTHIKAINVSLAIAFVHIETTNSVFIYLVQLPMYELMVVIFETREPSEVIQSAMRSRFAE
jgi:hypothetical protein